jgi:hypothetical protein
VISGGNLSLEKLQAALSAAGEEGA